MQYLLTILILTPSVLFGQMSNLRSENLKTLNNIFHADSFEITINSAGCFHSYDTVIKIKKIKKGLRMTYTGGRNDIELEKTIAKNKLRKIKRIFKKGFNLKKGGCTSRNTFVAKGNGQSVRFVDGRCSINFDLLNRLNRKLEVPKK